MLFATANGGRSDGKGQRKAQAGTEARFEAPGPRAIEVSRIEQPDALGHPGNRLSNLYRIRVLRPSVLCPPGLCADRRLATEIAAPNQNVAGDGQNGINSCPRQAKPHETYRQRQSRPVGSNQ